MKKIQFGLIALGISALLATNLANAADPNVEVKSSQNNVIVQKQDINKTDTDIKKEKSEVVKKEEPKFVITKASVYQQLSHDLRKEGYRLSWQISQDFPVPITTKTYKTWQESLLVMLDSVNKQGLFSDENGNTVKALVCPQLRYVVVTSLQNTSGVVDRDKRGCDLISKAPKKEDENNAVTSVDQNYYQDANYDQSIVPVSNQSDNTPSLNNYNKNNLQAFPPVQQSSSVPYQQSQPQSQNTSGIQPANLSALDN